MKSKSILLTLVSSVLVTACTMTNDAETPELPMALPEEVGMSSDRLAKVDDIVAQYIDEGRINGVVIGVTRRGQVVYHKAHGSVDDTTDRSMRLDSLFHMASSTKMILGVAAMMAIEDGLMSPSDPVEQYIPEFKGIQVAVSTTDGKMTSYKKKDTAKKQDMVDDKRWDKKDTGKWDKNKVDWDNNKAKKAQSDTSKSDKWKKDKAIQKDKDAVATKKSGNDVKPAGYRMEAPHRPPTIHDLLTHTAGLQTGGIGATISGLGRPDSTHSLATWIPKVAKGPLDFQPGTRWAYSSDVGLDVVARIIEIVTETPFNEFVQQRIFDPLDMKDTHWTIPEEKVTRLPKLSNDKGRSITSPNYFSGSIGLVSTARDFMHFEQMLVNRGTLFGQQLLKPESVDRMTTNVVGALYKKDKKGAGRGFGYTVNINEDPARSGDHSPIGSFGGGGVTGTMSWAAPSEELTFVYMVQGPTDLPVKISRLVTEAIVD